MARRLLLSHNASCFVARTAQSQESRCLEKTFPSFRPKSPTVCQSRRLQTREWRELKKQHSISVRDVVPMRFDTPRRAGYMRIVCISDTHSMHWNMDVPDGDVLVHAGDFSAAGVPSEARDFNSFLETQPHPEKILIAGNHDVTLDKKMYLRHYRRFHHFVRYDPKGVRSSLKCGTYLEESEKVINGVKFFGSPWQPEFAGWAFNLRRGEEARKHWSKIPPDVDVLVTHGPPLGIGDLCYHGGRVGCVDLLNRVREVKPRVHVYGHIHEGYGVYFDGNTYFINASACGLNYTPLRSAIIVDLPLDRRRPVLVGEVLDEDNQERRIAQQAMLVHLAETKGRDRHLMDER